MTSLISSSSLQEDRFYDIPIEDTESSPSSPGIRLLLLPPQKIIKKENAPPKKSSFLFPLFSKSTVRTTTSESHLSSPITPTHPESYHPTDNDLLSASDQFHPLSPSLSPLSSNPIPLEPITHSTMRSAHFEIGPMTSLAQEIMSGLKKLMELGRLSPWDVADISHEIDLWIHVEPSQSEWNIDILTVCASLLREAISRCPQPQCVITGSTSHHSLDLIQESESDSDDLECDITMAGHGICSDSRSECQDPIDPSSFPEIKEFLAFVTTMSHLCQPDRDSKQAKKVFYHLWRKNLS